ncbi:type I-F CRISPR-associated protein Csy1 [Ideonella livida]|uniref:Type I-F CRISPR-associated protein Csy1 n=1 Tax=Ideonella livida TaxID=2707176 RepID=A0A7C9PJ63_9BURK|nr:type I-F CRISPR-associated protein Csy1 [Ideonella livida]NDY93313.1 type I-F CRISPR-associated protein Csy1 [Ideonella livida]
MAPPDPQRTEALRALIEGFLQQRLADKLEKLDKKEKAVEKLGAEQLSGRAALYAKFEYKTWLADAARRVEKVQAVTHSLKPIHPDAKGTNLYCLPSTLAPLSELGSHALGQRFEADVVCDARNLDVYQFLKLPFLDKTLWVLCVESDIDLASAFSTDPAEAAQWLAAFASLAQPIGLLASHTLAKQLYWFTGTNPHSDADFHLLAPLFPTSLVHEVHLTLQEDRFGDAAKAAWAASNAGRWSSHPLREYPQLACRQMGGSNPQNISQLNSERRGQNLLLASLPPVWESAAVKPLLGVGSMFEAMAWRKSVRNLLKSLRQFLETDPANNQRTRGHRADLVEQLLDELMQLTAEQHTLPPGWSQDPACHLPQAQKAWLDPEAAPEPGDDALDEMAAAFARWLNQQLRESLAMADPEYQHWRKQARELFKLAEREGAL